MTTTISFTGAKGGVGTTTTAIATAILLTTEHAQSVALVSYDFESTVSVLGLVLPADGIVTVNAEGSYPFVVAQPGLIDESQYDFIVVDNGKGVRDYSSDHDHDYVVTTNAYDSVRAASKISEFYEGVIVLLDPQRALQVRDVEGAVGPVAAVITPSPAVARAADAGVLVSLSRRLSLHVVQLDNLVAQLVPGAVVAE